MNSWIRAWKVRSAASTLDIPFLNDEEKSEMFAYAFPMAYRRMMIQSGMAATVIAVVLGVLAVMASVSYGLPWWGDFIAISFASAMAIVVLTCACVITEWASELSKYGDSITTHTLSQAEHALLWLSSKKEDDISKNVHVDDVEFTKMSMKVEDKVTHTFIPTRGRIVINGQWVITVSSDYQSQTKWDLSMFIERRTVKGQFGFGGTSDPVDNYPSFAVDGKKVTHPDRVYKNLKQSLDYDKIFNVSNNRNVGGYSPKRSELPATIFSIYMILIIKICETKDFSLERAVGEL